MRQKSQTTHQTLPEKAIVEYTDCLHSALLAKKKFIGKAPRYFYLFSTQLCIAKTPMASVPERQFPLNSDTRVSWTYSKQLMQSVSFHIGAHSYQYYGSNDTLRQLKQQLSIRLFQMKIQDEYRAESVLGKGSYATVLELTNLNNFQQYAAKCIDQQRINEKKHGYKQLLQEIEAMRVVYDHPNILQLKELYLGNQNYYLVMELARGGSLLSVMKRRQTLFERSETRQIMRQLLEGVEHIHSYGIMHRDLKPENILFMNKNLGSLKIADFGLAQSIDQHPYTYAKCGTPGFVAPEILEQDTEYARYDVKCDIFSAGVIFYILLMGEPLFERKDKKEQLEQNRKCDINLQQIGCDQLSDVEKDILTRMLAKQACHRWSAEQLLKHRYFVQDDQIETEIDYPQLNNMAILVRSRMPTFQKNPFMQHGRPKALTTQVSKFKNLSLIMQSNLKLDKSSQDQLDQKLGPRMGSFVLSPIKVSMQ